MKANRLAFALVLLWTATVFPLAAQQTETDPKSVQELKAKAEAGDTDSQYQLALRYENGEGVAKSQLEAVKWYRKAAEQNHAAAQFNLGDCYLKGDGVKKNTVEAAKWLRKAAEQGVAAAQYDLALMYDRGEGVTRSPREAARWYLKAAEQGLAPAQHNLAVCYHNGEGISKNQVEAVKWFRKAAEQNDAPAQAALGECYCKGEGVTEDYVQAYKWISLAAGQGDENAKSALIILEENITREQIADGQKLARNFRPQKPRPSSDSSSADTVQSRPKASGSGFFITTDGYLITNQHVTGDGAQVRLITATGLVAAKVVKLDVANDLALLKAEGKFAFLPVVTSRPVKLGDTVATVGFPNIVLQGFAPKFARGEIGSLSGPQDDARYFQIGVPVQPGNSGGALVDEHGNVVGIVSAKLSAKAALSSSGALPENVNYAVKSSFLLGFLESVPDIAAKLKEPNTKDMKSAEVVEQAKEAAVLVLVY